MNGPSPCLWLDREDFPIDRRSTFVALQPLGMMLDDIEWHETATALLALLFAMSRTMTGRCTCSEALAVRATIRFGFLFLLGHDSALLFLWRNVNVYMMPTLVRSAHESGCIVGTRCKMAMTTFVCGTHESSG